LPDGFYLLKVTTSDQLSNPTDTKRAQAISEPFLVCNALPQIDVVAKPVITPDKAVVLTGLVLQKMVAVSAVQYRVDDGEWIAMVSDDGIFDALQERFTLLTAPLSSGKHTLEILAFNAVAGKANLKVSVEIP
jgi:hypothetical protein